MSLTHNFGAFERDLQAEVDKQRKAQERFAGSVMLQAFKEIVAGSPVDTGAFRASNNVSFGQPDLSVKERTGSSGAAQGGAEPGQIEAADSTIAAQPFLGQVTTGFITNNLVYAQAIEDGHSLQSPEPLYGIAEVNAKARIAAAS